MADRSNRHTDLYFYHWHIFYQKTDVLFVSWEPGTAVAMSGFTQKLEEFNVIAFDTRTEVIGWTVGHILRIGQVTVYAEKESGEALENVDNIHWVYGRKISEQKH